MQVAFHEVSAGNDSVESRKLNGQRGSQCCTSLFPNSQDECSAEAEVQVNVSNSAFQLEVKNGR